MRKLDQQNEDRAILPVTFPNSSIICSFVLLFGMDPTKSLLFATEMQTPMCLPGRISWLSHWKLDNWVSLWTPIKGIDYSICDNCKISPIWQPPALNLWSKMWRKHTLDLSQLKDPSSDANPKLAQLFQKGEQVHLQKDPLVFFLQISTTKLDWLKKIKYETTWTFMVKELVEMFLYINYQWDVLKQISIFNFY